MEANTVWLRFYEELNDFLPPQRRKRGFQLSLKRPVPLRHLIESQGVPHTEVELALLNGESVDLEQQVKSGDRVSLYPVFESFDVTPLLRLRKRPLRRTRFLADAHLGRLARYLRLLGFDTLYHETDPGDEVLIAISRREHRILLTRDRALLMRRALRHGCHVRQGPLRDQLEMLLRRLDLYRAAHPFTRCMECNGRLQEVSKAVVGDRLPSGVATRHERFWCCTGCGRVYWQGSHYARLSEFVTRLLGGA